MVAGAGAGIVLPAADALGRATNWHRFYSIINRRAERQRANIYDWVFDEEGGIKASLRQQAFTGPPV